MKKRKTSRTPYPQLKKRGIPIVVDEACSYVRYEDIRKALSPDEWSRFRRLFGVQTMSYGGPYPWDVEAVLERMDSGKRTGSQLIWD